MVAGGQTFLANDFQTARESCTAGLAHFLLLEIPLAVKTGQTLVAVRANGAVRLSAVFAEMTVAANIPAALSAIFAVFVFAAVYTIPALGAVFVFTQIVKAFSAAVAMSDFKTVASTVLRTAAAAAAAIAVPMVVTAAAAVLTVGIVRKCRKRQKRQHQHNRHEQR